MLGGTVGTPAFLRWKTWRSARWNGRNDTPVLPRVLARPEVFPEPNTFNIHRDNLDKVIHFGTGPHYCLGANIARAIYESVINEMLDRYESVELVSPAQYTENVVSRHISSLPIRVKSAAGSPATTSLGNRPRLSTFA